MFHTGGETIGAGQVGTGAQVLFLAAEGPAADRVTTRLEQLGARVTRATEVYSALAELLEDPCEHDLLVMDCDSFGGIDGGRRVVALLSQPRHHIPVILVSKDCLQQTFPSDWREPVILRAPVSAVSLRVALDQVLGSALIWTAA